MGSNSTLLTPPERPLPDPRLAIDLLNTTWQGTDGPVDWFGYDSAVLEFTAGHDHITAEADLTATRVALTDARNLIRRMFETPNLQDAEDDLLASIEAVLRSARTALDRSSGTPSLRITGDRPGNVVAVEAVVDALTLVNESPGRFRSCEHDDCTLWFLDTSKGGRRRWCSMSTCGNRAKAKRHYHRSST